MSTIKAMSVFIDRGVSVNVVINPQIESLWKEMNMKTQDN